MLLYRPYIKALRRDTKAVVGMLSQLPAEVDVEGHVKSIVLGIVKSDGSKSMEGLPGAPSSQLQPYGSGLPGMMGGPSMRGGWGTGGGVPAQGSTGGWFSRRSSNTGQQQFNDPRMYGNGMYNGGSM